MTQDIASYDRVCAQSPQLKVLGMLSATWMARCVYAAVKHDVFRAVAERREAAAIAEATGLPAQNLLRLLRGLEHLSLIQGDADGAFRLTELGQTLLPSAQGSLADMATLWGEEFHNAWTCFPDALASGKTAFDLHHGQSLFEYLGVRPDTALRFNRAMQSVAQILYPAIPDAVDWSQAKEVMDIGGGTGFLLAEILRRHGHLKGALFDVPGVVADARRLPWEEGLRPRIRFLDGDFFASIPQGADSLVLANILHDWDDQAAAQILANCRRALTGDGRLLIVEMILGHGDTPLLARSTDLNMLALTGGRERSLGDFAGLLAQAGFEIGQIHNVLDMTCALEAFPV